MSLCPGRDGRTPWEDRGVNYAVRAYAPVESFKKDLKMLRVIQESNDCRQMNLNV